MLVPTAPVPDASTVPSPDAAPIQPPADAVALFPVSASLAQRPAIDGPAPPRPRLPARISGLSTGLRTALVAGIVALVVLVIFVIQNAHVIQVSFLGIDIRLYLAVALLLTLIAGAALMTLATVVLLMTAWGTARIARLRLAVGRTLLAAPPASPGPPAA
jgi:uncharacterized integral membrane protein